MLLYHHETSHRMELNIVDINVLCPTVKHFIDFNDKNYLHLSLSEP